MEIKMPRYFKRLGAGKRTKLSRKRIGLLRGSKQLYQLRRQTREDDPPYVKVAIKRLDDWFRNMPTEKKERVIGEYYKRREAIFARSPLFADFKKRFDLKKPNELTAYAKMASELNPGDGAAQTLLQIVQTSKPIYRKGQVIFALDFSHFPALQESLGHIIYGIIVVDSRIPSELQNFVINHEIRENILENAEYKKIGKNVKRSHLVAVEREILDAQRTGVLKDLLDYLNQTDPATHLQRIRALKRLEKKEQKQKRHAN